jgi:hypothetical protein
MKNNNPNEKIKKSTELNRLRKVIQSNEAVIIARAKELHEQTI